MAMWAPEEGETHRLVLELKGSKNLTQAKYEEYKKDIAAVVKKHKAKIVNKEYFFAKKKPPKKKPGK